jgi:hypothetical protein
LFLTVQDASTIIRDWEVSLYTAPSSEGTVSTWDGWDGTEVGMARGNLEGCSGDWWVWKEGHWMYVSSLVTREWVRMEWGRVLTMILDIDSLPKDGIPPHPRYKYPMFVQAITAVPNVIKAPADLQKCQSNPAYQSYPTDAIVLAYFDTLVTALPLRLPLAGLSWQLQWIGLSTLPLAAVSSVLTALELQATDEVLGPTGARALDTAGYESVGPPFVLIAILQQLSVLSIDYGSSGILTGE